MKSENELRRERRVGLILSIAFVSIALTGWLTLRLVMPHHRVGSHSMMPTIHAGDGVAVNRLAYRLGAKPKVGDVASFRLKAGVFIYRIVAGPGDTIEMREKVLFRNGKRVNEPYAVYLLDDVPSVRSFGPIEVPPEHYFFLGDNRDAANDSRFRGCIRADRITGRMLYVIYIGECNDP